MKTLEFRYTIISIWVLTLLLWFGVITGCEPVNPPPEVTKVEKQETPTPRPTASKTKPAATPQVTKTPEPVIVLDVDEGDLRGVSVTFWHTWSGETGEVIEELTKKFNQTNQWGIGVQTSRLGSLDLMFSEAARALDGGEPPDLALAYLHQAQAWDGDGQVADLAPYVRDPVWGFTTEEQQDFIPVFWEHDLWEGKRLGIPAQRSGMLLFYNASWAEELGFDRPPDTLESFKEQACASAQAFRLDEDPDNDGMGGWIVTSDYAALLGWIYAFGGDIYNPDGVDSGESVFNFNTKEVGEAFTFLRELYDQGCAWKTEDQTPGMAFAGRQGLFTLGSLMDISFQKEAFNVARNRDTWELLPFPSPDNEPAFDVYGPSYVMLASSPERELASWLFIKWLSEADQQARLAGASGAFPLRTSTLEELDEYASSHPQWAGAVAGLSQAKAEPTDPSWGVVRWALSDAARQLFIYYFSKEEIPALLEFLDQMAHELYLGPVGSGLLDTPTFTPSPSATATVTPTPSRTASVTPVPSITATPIAPATGLPGVATSSPASSASSTP